MTGLQRYKLDWQGCLAQPNPIVSAKQLIGKENQRLKSLFDPQRSPTALLTDKARFTDALMIAGCRHFMAESQTDFALIATGGYGRNELFPHSDIDILVLSNAEPDQVFQERLSKFCNFLWDIGLKLGLSTRTIQECWQAARQDQTIYTSLLEMRLICGNAALFDQLTTRLSAQLPWTAEKFFAAKLAEQAQRYAKFHDTAYNLEPNIKEGPGGLRDLQIIAWVFKQHYQAASLRDLIRYDFLPRAELEELMAARDVLWRLRFALHLLTNRCEDRLVFDYQRELAAQFGYLDANEIGRASCRERV